MVSGPARRHPLRFWAGLASRDWAAVAVALIAVTLPDVMPVMVAALQRQFEIGPEAAGAVVSANMGSILLATAFAPLLLARAGERTLLHVGLAVMVAGNIVTIFVVDYAVLIGVRAVSGLGEGLACAVAYGLMARSARPGVSVSLYAAGQNVIAAGGMALLTLMIAAHGPAIFYIAVSVVALPALMLVPIATRDAPPRAIADLRRPVPMAGIKPLVAIFLVFTGMGLSWTFLERIGSAHALTTAGIATLLSLAASAGMVGPLLAALVADGLRFRPVLLAVAVAMILAAIGLGIGGTPLVTIGAACLLRFIWAFVYPFLFRLMAEREPSGRAATVTPLATAAASTIAPLLGGALLERIGLAALLCGSAALALAGLLLALGIAPQLRRSFA
ncbi:putative MFS family arabinose efflux permease [Sphingomonas sp. SORGH_AS 950]|uniref:MFS transporter n=1 Tax=Sphingomonas sp. SORGH_AS_0950 TaxID=3041792 RepID=UPI002788EDBC|nr:MFS transporter [Sphingomonas sp. SORGH_AS_0950]MDQ1158969.1 putative MFS family arabinose efflux permease [Sphingomonas sp. SORGH_AS_0950]